MSERKSKSKRKSAKAQARAGHPFVPPSPFIQTDALSELIRIKVRGLIADFLDEECEMGGRAWRGGSWRTAARG